MVVRQQDRAEQVGEHDLERIGGSEIVPVGPGGLQQWRDRRVAKMPSAESADSDVRLGLGELMTEQLPAQYAEDLGIEVLGHPALSLNGEQPRECSAAPRVADDLDAGRGVDDNESHAWASTRSACRASAASTLSSSGSGPARSSSMNARNAAGEASSAGFVSTTAESGGRSAGTPDIV